MKRSEINTIIKNSIKFIDSRHFALPPVAHWTPEDWQSKGHECDEIRDNILGWDITDYGLGKFDEVGLVLITIRNGNQNNSAYSKPYAEKLLISQENQVCPMHFHWNKMEDIINRGGGIMVIKLYNAGDNEELSDTDVTVVCDGVKRTVPAGTELELMPGESVTLTPRIYHAFWAKGGNGPVLIGEVSQCNDDNTDNRFYEPMGRFPGIEEDDEPYRLLCNEYPMAEKKFKECYLAGEIAFEDIDEYCERWGMSDSTERLGSYLGLTAEEESAWVDNSEDALYELLQRQKR